MKHRDCTLVENRETAEGKYAKYFDFVFAKYENVKFQEDLKVVRDQFGLQYPMTELIEDHKEFVRILSLDKNRQRFVSYWFKSKKMQNWDMLGVIESFQCKSFGLYQNLERFTFLLAKVGVVKLSQACTESVVKKIRVVEPRFAGFDETKLADGKRDRCMQEVWLCDNSIAINKLPLEDFEKTWRRDHLGSLKKDVRSKDYDVAITNFLDKEVSNLLFLEAN